MSSANRQDFREKKRARLYAASLVDLDSLVGDYITDEHPEVQWEDSNALFRFDSEQEAREAIQNRYYQLFLPDVDWTKTEIVKVQTYRPYSTDLQAAWLVVERLSDRHHGLELRRESGQWIACFGSARPSVARSAPVAICLAGLRSRGIEVDLGPDWLQ